MKRWKIAAVLVILALPMMGIAKGGSSFNGGGSSFSRGFSSHSITSRSATSGSKTSFGSFGSSPSTSPQVAPPGQKSKSALTQGLDKNAAQANALDTLDARNRQKAGANTPTAANG